MTVIDADAAIACGDRIVLILLLLMGCCCCCRNVEVVSGVREETPGIANSSSDDLKLFDDSDVCNDGLIKAVVL